MLLKSIDIQGFKSFPDKTRLRFDKRVTAIVGPNGSGKSNISDAVRWVLGEQSTRNLRGAKMEDVIFSGSHSRGAIGFCEVTLRLDNADRKLPYDGDEVEISRRLYRTGESEYRLGGKEVRLKDVNELLMDTGLGRDGYSIISQGKITQIMQAKPLERRDIFEEAAGISRYRYRKTEAEKQLRMAHDNMLRLQDIVDEIEGRIEPLKAQAKKATRYLELAGEKKELDISLSVHRLSGFSETLRQQDEIITLATADYEQLDRDIETISADMEAIQKAMQDCLVEQDNLRGTRKQAEEELSDNHAAIAVLHNDISHNNDNIERVKGELAVVGQSRADIDAQIDERRSEAAAIEERKQQTQQQLDDKQAELQSLLSRRGGVSEHIAALTSELSALVTRVSDNNMRLVTAQSTIDEVNARIEEARARLTDMDEQERTLRAEQEELQQALDVIDSDLRDLKNEQEGYALKQQNLASKVDKLRRDVDNTSLQLSEMQQRQKLLRSLEESMEGFGGSVKAIVKSSERGELRGIVGPVSRLIDVDTQHALAIETALGAGMQNIVTKDEQSSKQAIEHLKRHKLGRATFLPLTTVKPRMLREPQLASEDGFVAVANELVRVDAPYKPAIDFLLGRIVIADTLDSAMRISKRFSYQFRVVTLDGQVVNAGGSMTGGSSDRNAGMLSRRGEIERLEAQAREIVKTLSEQRQTLQAQQEELGRYDAQLTAIASEMLTKQEDRIKLDAESTHNESTLATYAQTRAQIGEAIDTLVQRKADNGKLIETAMKEAEALSAQQLEKEEQLSLASQQHESTRGARDALSGEIGDLQVAILGCDRDAAAVAVQIDELLARRERGSERADRMNQEIVELTQRNAQIEQEIEDKHALTGAITQRIEQIRTDITALTDRRNALEQQTTAKRAEERELMGKRELKSADIARFQEKRRALETDKDTVVAYLWDEYELTRTAAEQLAQPLEDEAAAQRRQTELRNKIRALGSVNVDAIEEYREVSERYEFLTTQLDDVRHSKLELEKLIGELTATMRTQFSESFAAIGKHFSQIFRDLFEGGSARLALTNEDDVLEAGIDIFVEPPGKIIKSLELLSGGEQAFVAIALYFAILKVRPSPFCLLDEIESALDDVNVTRFARYLSTLNKETQFILITHRRGTMENADMLYGVTMQEEGVSKILEMHVDEIEQKLGLTKG